MLTYLQYPGNEELCEEEEMILKQVYNTLAVSIPSCSRMDSQSTRMEGSPCVELFQNFSWRMFCDYMGLKRFEEEMGRY
jgi:hypothetical protein